MRISSFLKSSLPDSPKKILTSSIALLSLPFTAAGDGPLNQTLNITVTSIDYTSVGLGCGGFLIVGGFLGTIFYILRKNPKEPEEPLIPMKALGPKPTLLIAPGDRVYYAKPLSP